MPDHAEKQLTLIDVCGMAAEMLPGLPSDGVEEMVAAWVEAMVIPAYARRGIALPFWSDRSSRAGKWPWRSGSEWADAWPTKPSDAWPPKQYDA